MSLLKYALPALAAVGAAQAQCSASPTLTIENPSDASGPAGCRTFTGSIAIETSVSGTINIDGIQKLDGNLVAKNVSQLTTLGGSSLEQITGEFNLEEVQRLSSLNFPRLTDVDTIIWNALPNLQALSFTEEIKKAAIVDIQNTQLNALDGINLEIADTFYIANNPYLTKMDLQLGNVSTELTIEANSPELEVTLPNLIWAANVTFRNVSSVNLPSLESLNASMGFFGNAFESFDAPNLTTIGESLSFSDNMKLSNISLPVLKTVNGGFLLGNNPELDKIEGFPKLETVGGALDFSGEYSSVDLPAIKDVRGAFNLQSTKDINKDCDRYQAISGQNDAIKGEFTCESSTDNPTNVDGTPTGPDKPKKSAAGHAVMSSSFVMIVSGAIAVLLALY